MSQLEKEHEQPAISEASRVKTAETIQMPSAAQLRYFHIDDMPDWHEERLKALQKKWSIPVEQRVGTARSVPEAMRKLHELVRVNQAPDLILLDQKFLSEEGNEDNQVPDEYASEQFVREFEQLASDPTLGKMLKQTKIITVSGSDDDEYLEKLQRISGAVLGRAPKGDFTEEYIAAILADAGVVQEDMLVNASRRTLLPLNVTHEIRGMNYKDFNALKKEDDLQKRIFLAKINNYRRQVALRDLEVTSAAFESIMESIKENTSPTYVMVPSDLLLVDA